MTTRIDQVDDRDYWVLEHSSRSFRPGGEADAMWVRHDAYTMPSERSAILEAVEIESGWVTPQGWVTEHRFRLRHVASPVR